MTDLLPKATAEGDEIDLSTIPPFDVGGLPVRPALREIGGEGSQEVVEPRVLKVLVVLAQEHGNVVSRERLILRAWSGRIVGDDSINNCVAKLRRVGRARGAFDIETVPRVGYRLVERSAAGAAAARRSNRFVPISLALVSLVLVAGAALWAQMARSRPPLATVEAMEFRAHPANPVSGAIADRLRDHLTVALAAQQIDVVASGGSKAAAFQVHGDVEVSGPLTQARVTLADTRSQTILWQAVFTGPSDLGGALPEQATARTMTALTMATEIYAASGGRITPATLRSYIQVRDGYREQRNPVEQVARVREINRALPRLALAHATAAQILLNAAADQPPATREAWNREAVAEAQLAIDLDPDFGGGYTALSAALSSGDYSGRQAALEEGLRRAPLDGVVQSFWGLFLAETGRPQEALPYVRRSQALDPFAAPRRVDGAPYYAAVGALDEGRALLIANRRTWPDNRRIPASETLFALLAASPDEGRSILESLRGRFPGAIPRADLWMSVFEALECRCGVDRVASEIREAVEAGEVEAGPGFIALARLGAVEPALAVAERVRSHGHLREHGLLFANQASAVRHDRRFMDLAGRLGLVSYWRSSNRWPEFCADPRLPYSCKDEAERVVRAGA